MKINFKRIAFFILLFNTMSFAQWGAGLSFNLKNEEPKKGVGFIVTYNLPFQFPIIGFNVRLEGDYYKKRQGADVIERDILLSLGGTLFYKDLQPYFAVGTGFSFQTADDETINSFLINELAGIQLAIFEPVYPFLEIKFLQYIAVQDEGETDAEIFQIAGAIGFRIEF